MTIVDTGPIVALFNANDQWHEWAVRSSKELTGPLHTCEAVLTEVFFLLGRVPQGRQKFSAALSKPGLFALPWRFDQDRRAVLDLLQKYADTPSSLADVCLVRMAELTKSPKVWTTDKHFGIYRLRGGKKIPTLSP